MAQPEAFEASLPLIRILEDLHVDYLVGGSLASSWGRDHCDERRRRTISTHHIPRGLLTRAWLRHRTGDADGARADLDEAWEIAERGPMPLFQADVQLYRARLFRDRDALADARRLIEKHGYGRRLEELADAEAAAVDW